MNGQNQNRVSVPIGPTLLSGLGLGNSQLQSTTEPSHHSFAQTRKWHSQSPFDDFESSFVSNDRAFSCRARLAPSDLSDGDCKQWRTFLDVSDSLIMKCTRYRAVKRGSHGISACSNVHEDVVLPRARVTSYEAQIYAFAYRSCTFVLAPLSTRTQLMHARGPAWALRCKLSTS